MSTIAVGLIGATGLLGSPLLKALSAQPIKVVILHRPTSKLPPTDAEKRVFDISGNETDIHKALEGIDILINATSKTDHATDLAFLSHLSTLPKPLKAYIPSDFSLNYTPDEVEGVELIEGKEALIEHARELGIPTTLVHNGVIEPLALTPFTGIDLATSTLTLYPGAEEKTLSITSPAYVAAAVAEIVQHPNLKPLYTVVEYKVTGREIATALEKAGKKAVIKPFTEAEIEAVRASGGLGSLSAAVRVKWGKGEWPEPGAYTPAAPRGNINLTVQSALARSA
ncbi:hypothetical protein CspHIS471_0304720 [Cutaneotrichosporon sp. HIS471]|nr:hypothetical protein CspHIS471_0304720 [Cutaneotrichosporon sp. HIS471]